jgi:DNA-binding transcriptional MerR regulator
MTYDLNKAGASPARVRALTGVSRSQLRYWETLRAISPTLVPRASRVYHRYPPEQVQRIARVMHLLRGGYSLSGAIRSLDQEATASQNDASATENRTGAAQT